MGVRASTRTQERPRVHSLHHAPFCPGGQLFESLST